MEAYLVQKKRAGRSASIQGTIIACGGPAAGNEKGVRDLALWNLPIHAPGMKIGLLGGSFNPPHQGHLWTSWTALQRLSLDRIWWLVTPGNPLKDNRALPDVGLRLQQAQVFAEKPWLEVTAFESALRGPYTYETVRYLKRRCPEVHFVWLMGTDVWQNFHRWYRWKDLARLMPLAVVERPVPQILQTTDLSSPAASDAFHRWQTCHKAQNLNHCAAYYLSNYRRSSLQAKCLPYLAPPVWTWLKGPGLALSSTQLRREQGRS